MMSKERELLKKWVSQFGNLRHDFNLLTETKLLLAQPEQDLDALKKDWVNFGYEAGRKSALSEQEPVVKITSIHADGENLPVVITGVVLSDAVNIWDLPIKNNNLLFLAPSKREPLSDGAVCEILLKKEWKGFVDLVRIIEKTHGIIGGGE